MFIFGYLNLIQTKLPTTEEKRILNYLRKKKKILTQIEKNKEKPAKVGGFRARLQKAMEEAEKKKRNNEKRR